MAQQTRVTVNFDLGHESRQLRLGYVRNFRSLHDDLGKSLRRRTPVDTGLMQGSWESRYRAIGGRTESAWINKTRYSLAVAAAKERRNRQGTRRPLSKKEQENRNFHIRAIRDAMSRHFPRIVQLIRDLGVR